MGRRSSTVLLVTALLLTSDAAAEPDDVPPSSEWTSQRVRAAMLHELNLEAGGFVSSAVPRSVPLALGLSAVVPGVGQAYNRQWIKAGVALAVEVALIAGYVKWRNEGRDGESAFRAFAHRDWNPAQYAEWINDYSVFLELNHGGVFTFEEIVVPGGVDFSNPAGWSETDRAAVLGLFSDIRGAESQLFHPETGASFSHRLPGFGEQQYYELIGKYFQFAPGWSDYPDWIVDSEYTDAIDPERSDAEGNKISVSPKFYDYARDHARSQDLLRRASKVTSLIVVNHVLAAIDAAVFARLHNNRLAARVAFLGGHEGRPVPAARLTLRI